MRPDPRVLKGLRREQEKIGKRVRVSDGIPGKVKTIGGFDLAYRKDTGYACGVVLDYGTMEVLERKIVKARIDFPYISTFLSFREAPAVNAVFSGLEKKPDVMMINGQGIMHPMRAGLASHVGVVLGKPSIGIAQRKLVGEYRVPGEAGDFNPITYEGEQVGWILRSKEGCNPVFVSPGHMVSLERSLGITKHCLKAHKLPEPVRLADRFAGEAADRE